MVQYESHSFFFAQCKTELTERSVDIVASGGAALRSRTADLRMNRPAGRFTSSAPTEGTRGKPHAKQSGGKPPQSKMCWAVAELRQSGDWRSQGLLRLLLELVVLRVGRILLRWHGAARI